MATTKTPTTKSTGILGSLKGAAAEKVAAKAAEVAAEAATVAAEAAKVATEEVKADDTADSKDNASGTATTETADKADGAGAFDWDTLPAAEVAVYSRNVARTDLEETTPKFIKDRVTFGFEKTEAAGLDKKGQPQPVQVIQNCGSAERADEFLKLARKYATFKNYTLRGTANPARIAAADGGFISGTGLVSFAVKPREMRKRVAKPDEAVIADAMPKAEEAK